MFDFFPQIRQAFPILVIIWIASGILGAYFRTQADGQIKALKHHRTYIRFNLLLFVFSCIFGTFLGPFWLIFDMDDRSDHARKYYEWRSSYFKQKDEISRQELIRRESEQKQLAIITEAYVKVQKLKQIAGQQKHVLLKRSTRIRNLEKETEPNSFRYMLHNYIYTPYIHEPSLITGTLTISKSSPIVVGSSILLKFQAVYLSEGVCHLRIKDGGVVFDPIIRDPYNRYVNPNGDFVFFVEEGQIEIGGYYSIPSRIGEKKADRLVGNEVVSDYSIEIIYYAELELDRASDTENEPITFIRANLLYAVMPTQ